MSWAVPIRQTTVEIATVVVRVRGDRFGLDAVDVLARLALEARRGGCTLAVTRVAPEVRQLLELVGVSVEVLGEPEDREEPGLDEGVVGDDPAL